MRISADQVKGFEQIAWQRFEGEMVEHSQEFAPVLSESLGEEQLRVAVRGAIGKARSYGFTNRGPIRLYVELMLLCGSSFDTDPQYRVVGDMLRKAEEQMAKAERIHVWHNTYLEEVSGKELQNLAEFLRRRRGRDARVTSEALSVEDFRTFSEKTRYAGDAVVTMLIERAKQVTAAHGVHRSRSTELIVALMLALGHGCTNDPLYPWISDSLRDEKDQTAAGPMERLEENAMTWLTYVLDGGIPKGAA